MRSLRARVGAAVAGVVVLTVLVVAVAGVLLLRAYLLQRSDDALVAARAGVAQIAVQRDGRPFTEQALRRTLQAGLAVDAVHLVADGRVVASVEAAPSADAPTPAQVARLRAGPGWLGGRDERALTVDAQVALATATGDVVEADALVLVADVGDDAATVRRLVEIELVVGGVALAGALALTWWLVGRGLQPLRRMAQDAGRVAAGDRTVRLARPGAPDETRDLAHALDDALDARARAEARLRDFVADAAHDLRTPLTSVHGWADLYLQGGLDADGVERAMERIGEQTSRMRHLVDRLTLLARLDADVAPERAPIDLRGLVDDVVDDVAVLEPARRVVWVRPPEPVVVAGDRAQLAHVLANLVGNVLRHTPERATLTLELAADDAEAVLTVRDDGPGLPRELEGRAFERFVRGGGGEGSGLGLAIVAGVVRAHGGHVGIQSAPGAGTTVTVRLPSLPR